MQNEQLFFTWQDRKDRPLTLLLRPLIWNNNNMGGRRGLRRKYLLSRLLDYLYLLLFCCYDDVMNYHLFSKNFCCRKMIIKESLQWYCKNVYFEDTITKSKIPGSPRDPRILQGDWLRLQGTPRYSRGLKGIHKTPKDYKRRWLQEIQETPGDTWILQGDFRESRGLMD
jgi:hypothetical protein